MSKGSLIKETPYSEITATLEALDYYGVTREHFARIRSDVDYAKLVTKCMLSDGTNDPIHDKLVRAVMGKNFWGIEDWLYYSLIKEFLTKEQRRKVVDFPWWDNDTLNSPCPFNKGKLVKDTHFAFLGISGINGQPLTVAKWLKLYPGNGQPKFYCNNDPWHAGQPHTDVATMQLRWYLMLRDIVPGSTSKTPEEQVVMLPEGYEVPTTIMEVTKDILVFRKTGERPNGSRWWAACTERTVETDKVSVGSVSCVGFFDEFGLDVTYWDGYRNGRIGLGASRKLPA